MSAMGDDWTECSISERAQIEIRDLPTPLEHLPNLSKELNGPEIWIKRDDCTGMSSGGNKTRKLEFLLAEAREQGADIVLTDYPETLESLSQNPKS